MTETILTVGTGQQYATINAAILAADQMGGNADIRVQAGTYLNDGGYLWDGINNVTIEGTGGVAKIIDPTYYAGGKAAIVTGGQNIVLENLDISGVAVPDGNGAGVRYDQGALTLNNVSLHNNQNGILGAADSTGAITIENSNIYSNGTSAGNTHNIYIGNIAQFTLTNSYVHDANVGHEVKSRAQNNTITNNVVADNNSTSSYSIDLPNGGNANITGNLIEQGPNGQNHIVNSYGEEGASNLGSTVIFSSNSILNDNASGAGPLWANSGATITGTGNTAYNLGAANLGNGMNPASVTPLATEPNLAAAEQAITAKITAQTVATQAHLSPIIASITGIPFTGVRLTGTSEAGSSVTVWESENGLSKTLGTTTAGANGAWSLSAPSGLGHIDLSAIQRYTVTASDAAHNTGSMNGDLVLTDTGTDQLAATPGMAEIFAVMSNLGADTITGFTAAGPAHDVIDFSGRGFFSFSQVQHIMSGSADTVFTLAGGKAVTLEGVAPTSLSAADFRFS